MWKKCKKDRDGHSVWAERGIRKNISVYPSFPSVSSHIFKAYGIMLFLEKRQGESIVYSISQAVGTGWFLCLFVMN